MFIGYSYVSGMYRVCIGYVSGKCRRRRGARGEVCQPRMSTDGHGKRNIDILARKLAEIIVRPKGDKKSKLSKLKTKRVIG